MSRNTESPILTETSKFLQNCNNVSITGGVQNYIFLVLNFTKLMNFNDRIAIQFFKVNNYHQFIKIRHINIIFLC